MHSMTSGIHQQTWILVQCLYIYGISDRDFNNPPLRVRILSAEPQMSILPISNKNSAQNRTIYRRFMFMMDAE
jgi:hypothetical protein